MKFQNIPLENLDFASEPRAELQRLNSFLGTWHLAGENGLLSPQQPGEKISGEEIFYWLDGNFFLAYEWNRKIGEIFHTGRGIFGYDSLRKKYFAQFFDNLGCFREYDLKIRENRLTLTGEIERAVIFLNETENLLITRWESLHEGEWKLLCNLEGRRVLPLEFIQAS
jgi:hypothetical protein